MCVYWSKGMYNGDAHVVTKYKHMYNGGVVECACNRFEPCMAGIWMHLRVLVSNQL